MFLDDQLYIWTKSKVLEHPEDFQSLVNELYRICEDWFKPKLNTNMTYKEGKILMDKVFWFWNSFIKKLEKDKWFLIDILKNYPYEKEFMSNPNLKEIYDKGK